MYSNIISEEFEGNSDIETPPSISLFFNMLKLAVLIILNLKMNLNNFIKFTKKIKHSYKILLSVKELIFEKIQ